ncbi:MAG TPA: hypothetical protein VFR58_17040 [Flavisolibacter sp.]|nr:hypothetical protein [Flavisolibacter sp.]
MSKNIEESQQQSQGVTIGNQGNEDMPIPQGTKGSHRPKNGPDDTHIANRERSSATNEERAREAREGGER